jgi:hypothetical protein
LDKNPKNRISANDCVGLIEGIKNSTQLSGEPPKLGKSKRKLIFALVAGLILSSAGLGYTLLSSKDETPVAKPETVESLWSASVEGDTNSQTGTGDKFSVYLCDQAVIANSLVVKELTNPPTKPSAVAKVIKGDERCGSEFDTIVVSGPVNFDKKTRDYVVAGSTSSGFIIQYEFSIKEKSQA